jgi:proteasome lid subunit RPN8/RPN11
MHIADHQTRMVHQKGTDRAMGILMGDQQGRVVNIFEAFEMVESNEEEAKTMGPINKNLLDEDMKLFKEAFTTYEMLGWYCTGEKVDKFHSQCQSLLTQYNERPLFLLFNPKSTNDKDLPISIYEEMVHQSGQKEFSLTSFKIESDEGERVTAGHCAKVVSGGNEGGSTVTPHYSSLAKAVAALNARVKTIAQYLADVKNGKVEIDHKVLRSIKGMCGRLPTMLSSKFQGELLSDYNDALLITYLAAVTKSTTLANDVVEKFNNGFGKKSSGRGMMMFS